ncbi:MFS transporter [Streptomyces asiaticus]|uniref:MFS transporter n=1 Tax=Streptomyces asiaticus TaxID=114695 RepID=UPI0037F68620
MTSAKASRSLDIAFMDAPAPRCTLASAAQANCGGNRQRKELLERKNLSLWFVATSLSLIGDSALWLAVGLWAKQLTGSSGAAGIALFFYAVPNLVAPGLALIVDRVPRHALYIAMNVAMSAWCCLALVATDRHDLWILYLLLFGIGVGGCINKAVGGALLPYLSTESDLGRTNAVIHIGQQLALVLSPTLGAALYASFGPVAVALFNSGTFAAAALCAWLIRVDEPPIVPARFTSRDFLAGVHHVRTTPAIRRVVIGVASTAAVFGIYETVIFSVTTDGLHRAASFLGTLVTAKGFGSLMGSLVTLRFISRIGEWAVLKIGLALLAFGTALLTASSTAWVVTGFIVTGFAIPFLLVPLAVAVQRHTPENLLGRGAAVAEAAFTVPHLVSTGVSALVVDLVDYRLLLAVLVSGVLFSLLYTVTRPRLDAPEEPREARKSPKLSKEPVDAASSHRPPRRDLA